MINKIIEFSVRNRLFVYIVTVALIIFGLKSFQELSIDAVPDITNTQVQINTPVIGLVPEEIERMVTFPIEFSMNGIADVENIRSISRYGISQVTIIFKEKTDILRARQLVQEKIQTLDLPEGIKPEMGPISSGLGEIYHYAIEAKKVETDPEKRLLQLMELRSIQDWFIKPRLLTVKGVTEVNTIGGYEKQFFIQPKIDLMSLYGIHFDDIKNAIEGVNANVGGGYVQQTSEQIFVRAIGLLNNISDIENVVIKRLSSAKIIKIKDIATVKLDKELRTGAGTLNGEESIIGTAFMLLGENSRFVAQGVDDKLQDIRKDLPAWVELKTIYDRSHLVNATLGTVEHNLLMGAGLVILFLLLLVGNMRAAIITALVIPISLLITFILMKWQKLSGNLMSLGALDFGIIVDGAVIVIENCVHRIQMRSKELNRSLTRQEVQDMVISATSEIRSAAGFGELIVIVVFIPLFALTGIEGKMFGPMALTFVMALVAALLLSFTFVPAMAATFLSGKVSESRPFLMRFFEKLYKPVLEKSLNHKKIILGVGIFSILLGVTLFSRMGAEFIPQLDEGDFAVQVIRPANINIETSLKLQMMTEKLVKEFPQVKDIFARTGAAEVATDPMGVNISDVYVMLHEKEKWPKNDLIKTKKDLIEQIKNKLEAEIPAQVLMFSQPVELRFNELLEGTRAAVAVKVFGDDINKLLEYSEEIAEVIKTIDGAGEVEVESSGRSPLLQYTPKYNELAQYGVTAKPVLETIQTSLAGLNIGDVYEGVKKYPIVMRLSEDERKNINTIRNLPVGISENYNVPIEKVSNIEFIETFTSITRENSQRRIAVLINPETRDIDSFVNEAMKKVGEKIKLEEGYFLEWSGAFKNLQSAKESLRILVPLSFLLIFAMLYAAFKNFAQILLIFSCVPMGLIGGVLSLIIMGMPLSISAGVGFIALFGICILNGVVLISYFNQMAEKGMEVSDVIKNGAMSRFRPVLMTALTDIFGFIPMMFSHGLGAEVQRPLATVVVGGIISATILTLIVLPTLYGLFYKHMRKNH